MQSILASTIMHKAFHLIIIIGIQLNYAVIDIMTSSPTPMDTYITICKEVEESVS